MTLKPTQETYSELQTAYTHFNEALFAGRLPDCLITLQRGKNTLGYLSASRFTNREGRLTDEIAMNPSFFAVRDLSETLSTLVHEMVHLWQYKFGKPGRGRYHNKEWSKKMKQIGLHPSSNGRPGGEEQGDRMSHFVVNDGPFQHACRKLLTTEFQLSWLDRFPEATPSKEGGEAIDDAMLSIGIVDPLKTKPKAKNSKQKFSCPTCDMSAWGKPSLNLVCGDCGVTLEATKKGTQPMKSGI